jgi:hypothetical protein
MNYRKTVLTQKQRVFFNPANPVHMKDYALFVKTANWRNGCNYFLEDPYQDIPTMINSKIINHVLSDHNV